MSYTLISTITVGSGGAASVTFMPTGNIPSIYTDLVLLCSARTNRPSQFTDGLRIILNGDTGNTSSRFLFGYNNAVTSGTRTILEAGSCNASLSTANTFSNNYIYIPNYRSSVAKSVSSDGVSETNAAEGAQFIQAGLWTGTAPITSISLSSETGSTLLEHSSFSLYGITAGSSGGVIVS